MLPQELVIRSVIATSLLLSSLFPVNALANSSNIGINQSERSSISSNLPLNQLTTSCDEFTTGLDGWTIEGATGGGTSSNPAGMMRLSSVTGASSITATKTLSASSGVITVTGVFTSNSPTSLYFWVKYADESVDYIFANGTTSGGVQTYNPTFTTPANKVPVALYFHAGVSPLFSGFQIDIGQVCVTSTTPPDPPPANFCDEFTTGFDGWTIEGATGGGTASNPAGMMRLSSVTGASSITATKTLPAYSGAITVTGVFTSHSPTSLYFWVKYADDSLDYIYANGTTSGGVQTYNPTFTTPANKVPVALYFHAGVSPLFSGFQIDIGQVCVTSTASPDPPPASFCDEFTTGFDSWTIEGATGGGTSSNPAGMMRLSSVTGASSITATKTLSASSGAITVTGVFTSHSPTSLYFWVKYADESVDYIFANGTTSGGVQTYNPTFTTPANKVPVALYFHAGVSPLFSGFQIDIGQVCVTSTAPPDPPPASFCDEFTTGLDGWTIEGATGGGTASNPAGMMRLSSVTGASSITATKTLPAYSGAITVTGVFTSHSPTSLYFWVKYADDSLDYIYANGTTSGGVQTYNPTFTTPANKVPVALYFHAGVSPLFSGFQIDVGQVCTSLEPTLQVNPTVLSFSAIADGNNPATQSFSINNGSTGSLNWTASENINWLSLSSLSGTTPATVNAQININGLSPGIHTGQVIVSSPDALASPKMVNITLTINPPNPPNSSLHLTAEAGYASIQLTWNPISNPDVTYRISRAISGTQTLTAIATISDTIYFDDDALVVGTTYCYQVEALQINNSVIATSNVTCAIFGQTTLWMPDTWAFPGQTAIVPVNIRNATGLRIAASDIWLDFDGTVIKPVAISATALTAGYTWAYSTSSISGTTNYSRTRISALASPPPMLHGDGSLFWLSFQVLGSAGDETPLNLREFINGVGGSTIYTPDDLSNPIPLFLQDSTLYVANTYSLGDLNGNKVIEAVDAYIALQFASHILTPTPQQLYAGDINGNGEVDAADASMIFYYAVHSNWPPLPVTSSGLEAAATNSVRLTLDDINSEPGDIAVTTLRAENLVNWAGGKFVIAYNPALIESINNVTVAGLATGFALQFYDNGAGLLYIALADDTPITGSGALAIISMRIASDAPNGSRTSLTLAEVHLNDMFGRDFATSALQQVIQRDNGEISIGVAQPSQIYLPIVKK